MDKVSYALGMGIGTQLVDMGASELNIDDFAQAIKDVIAGKAQMEEAVAQATVQKFFQEKAEAKSKALKAEGEAYLAENAKKEGVKVTASGLQYKVLTEGTGKSPKATDKVVCH